MSLLFLQFLQYFIPKNAFAKGIARASKGFELAIDVLQVLCILSKNKQKLKQSFKVLKLVVYDYSGLLAFVFVFVEVPWPHD